MCITITVRETGRRVMGLSTTIINIVLVFLSLTLFVAAVGIRFKLDKKLELMNGYESGALPFYMMLTGGLMFFCHLVAVKFCYDATYAETRSNRHHHFVTVIFVVVGMFLFVFITVIITLVHSGKIRSSLEDGIWNSLKAYKSDLARKQTIDHLQMDFECCGVKSYKDWFHIGWVNLMYINTESDDVKRYLKGGEFIKDDVPFSCCSTTTKRACVHHSVLDFKSHRNYDAVTLNNAGCSDAVMAYFKSLLIIPVIILLFVILILQAIDIIVMRMLQTSIFEAYELNDPEAPSESYCFKGIGGGGDVRSLFNRKKGGTLSSNDDDDEGDDDDDDDNRPRGYGVGGDDGGGGGRDTDDDGGDFGDDKKEKRKTKKEDQEEKRKRKDKKGDKKNKKKSKKEEKLDEKKKRKNDSKAEKKKTGRKKNKKIAKKKESKKKSKKQKKLKKQKKPQKTKASKSKGGRKK